MERSMGDAYVKSEFRLHRESKPELVETFVEEWSKYAVMLESAPLAGQGGKVGAALAPEQLDDLTEEQLQQLDNLRQSTRELESEIWNAEFGGGTK